jgi:hypothetical protein
MRKYVTQFVALERNAEKGIPGHMAQAFEAYRAGRLAEYYAPLVVDDEMLARGLEDGTYAVDTRLRDALRSLGFGEPDDARHAPVTFGRPEVEDAALFAAESSALQESDLGLALGERVEALERRIGVVERRPLSRVRSAVRGRRR